MSQPNAWTEAAGSAPARDSNGTFRSLRGFNYRTWAMGSVVSNVGTWMQRTAQDWLVLAELTDRSATAVGTLMALQFGPQALLLPLTGYAADRLDRRKLLFVTQACAGVLALGLGLLTLFGLVELWHVYVFGLLLGCVTAFDGPARQTFVSELVSDNQLSNAVALNSTSFNVARLLGPAAAGVAIARYGTGWVFLLNAVSFGAVLVSLSRLRVAELHRRKRATNSAGLLEGFRYVRGRADLAGALGMLFLIGTFGLNFPIFISTMAVTVFHKGAGQFGLLTSIMAVGSVAGALVFGAGCLLAALMPSYGWFGVALAVIGISAQTFTTTANGTVQLGSDPEMRGRVMAIYMAIALGGTPIGAPLVGFVADTWGPRWALGVGALAGFSAALVGFLFLSRRAPNALGTR